MSQHSQQEIRRGYGYALIVLLIWSGFVVISRFSGRSTLTPYDVIALRYAVAGMAILPLWWRCRTPVFSRKKLVLSLTGAVGFTLFAFHGFHHAPASHAGILLQGCLPFTVAVMMYFVTGERPNRQRLLGLSCIALGVVAMAVETFRGQGMALMGDGFFIGASLCWALYSVLLRRWSLPPLESTIAVTWLATLIYLPVYLCFLPKHFADTPLSNIALIGVYQGVIVAVIQMVFYTKAVEILGASRMAVITSGVPVVASLGAWALLGEAVTPPIAVGLAMVSFGAIISNLSIGVFPTYFRHKIGGHRV